MKLQAYILNSLDSVTTSTEAISILKVLRNSIVSRSQRIQFYSPYRSPFVQRAPRNRSDTSQLMYVATNFKHSNLPLGDLARTEPRAKSLFCLVDCFLSGNCELFRLMVTPKDAWVYYFNK